MIKKKIIINLIIFFFLTSCGYQPLISEKKNNFNINNIEISGDKKINNIIYKNLKGLKNNDVSEKNFDLQIISSIKKNVTSNDTDGDPKTYSLSISIKLKIKQGSKVYSEKEFLERTTYNKQTTKFELKQYEGKITETLGEKISDEIIFFLSRI